MPKPTELVHNECPREICLCLYLCLCPHLPLCVPIPVVEAVAVLAQLLRLMPLHISIRIFVPMSLLCLCLSHLDVAIFTKHQNMYA